jgi:hypothetical protein
MPFTGLSRGRQMLEIHADDNDLRNIAATPAPIRNSALMQRVRHLLGQPDVQVQSNSEGRVTKAGDPYLRMLLILGARSVLQTAATRTDPVSRWVVQLAAWVGYWKAIVAIAPRTHACAGRCWPRGESFKLSA